MVTILPEYAGCFIKVAALLSCIHISMLISTHFNEISTFIFVYLDRHVYRYSYWPTLLWKPQDQGLSLHSIVRLRYNLKGLTATFEEGIAVLVAIGTARLATIHSNKWPFSECINVLCILAKFWDLECWPLYWVTAKQGSTMVHVRLVTHIQSSHTLSSVSITDNTCTWNFIVIVS